MLKFIWLVWRGRSRPLTDMETQTHTFSYLWRLHGDCKVKTTAIFASLRWHLTWTIAALVILILKLFLRMSCNSKHVAMAEFVISTVSSLLGFLFPIFFCHFLARFFYNCCYKRKKTGLVWVRIFFFCGVRLGIYLTRYWVLPQPPTTPFMQYILPSKVLRLERSCQSNIYHCV